MIYKNVEIDNFAYELPPVIISSEDIEQRLAPVYRKLKLPEGRLELMSGIRERRFWKEGTPPSTGAYLAGKKALDRAAVPKAAIGCLINCSVSRDFLEPATASVVHEQLGLRNDCLIFDISNACLGVLSGMIVLANMIENGQIEAGLLVAGENCHSLVESTITALLEDASITRQSIKAYFASLTIGSGAVAVVMNRSGLCARRGHLLKYEKTLAATEFNHLCRGNADKGMSDNSLTLMNTDSEALLHSGVDAALRTWTEFSAESGLTARDFDCICTHQVGNAHRKLLFERLSLDPDKNFSSLEFMGNVGSVSCPLTVAMAEESGRLKAGGVLAMLGIGSGINCTMLGVEW